MDIKNEILWRIYLVMLGVVVFAMLIFMKTIKIQVVEGDKWRAKADSLYVKYRPVKAERGHIFSADGSLLATSLPFFELRMDMKTESLTDEIFYQEVDSLAQCLAAYVDNSYTAGGYRDLLINARENGNRYLLIKKNVSYPELQEIKKFPLFNKGRFKGGLIIKRQSKRQRPFQMLAHRTIGYIRENSQPVGLEGAFDEILKGEEGQQLMQRVSGGAWIPIDDLTGIEPKSGNDIVTTLDINLQDVTENALLKCVKKHQADHGTAILMEVKTGELKAIANIGQTENGSYWETYNFAIGESMEPGSTYKLAAIMALLEDNYIELEDSINLDLGKHKFYNEEMVDASYHGLKKTTIQRSFELSSNVGIAQLTHHFYNQTEKGKEKFIQHLNDFHLNETLNIEIEGEGIPLVKNVGENGWSGTTIPWMSIGYETKLTPLQLLTFYNAVANDGKMMKPFMVKEIQDFGKTEERFKPKVIDRKIASASTIEKAQILLEAVVRDGTAKKIYSEDYRLAGKTGTSILNYKRDQHKSNRKYQASFVGYFPADNPIYSCIVVVNDPKVNGFYGGTVAAPVFREIADRCFAAKLELHEAINQTNPIASMSNLPEMEVGFKGDLVSIFDFLDVPTSDKSSTNWVVGRTQTDSLELLARRVQDNVVPNVTGMGLRDAIYLLENRGLQVKFSGFGKVVRQSLKPGTRTSGQEITLVLN